MFYASIRKYLKNAKMSINQLRIVVRDETLAHALREYLNVVGKDLIPRSLMAISIKRFQRNSTQSA